MPDSVTQLRAAGPIGQKRTLAILGDGFADADQTTYNDWVQNTVIGGVFSQDYFYEDGSAWNIFRVDLISNDSGVSQKTYNADGTVKSITLKDTALGMIYSGDSGHPGNDPPKAHANDCSRANSVGDHSEENQG